MQDELITVRTLRRVDDPRGDGASIQAGVTVTLPKTIAEKLIAKGKAKKVEDKDKPSDR